MSLADDLREHARATGIDRVGCTSPSPFLVGEERREFDPRGVLPEAQAVVVAAFYTYGFETAEPSRLGAPRGRFGPWTRASMRAVHHGERTLKGFLEAQGFKAVPTGDVPLKMAAVRSGIASYGKNCIVHAHGLGSYIKLSAVLTDAKLDCTDRPIETSDCGDCTACVEACPTHALETPYALKWSRCITALYWGRPVPRDLRHKAGTTIFRCGFCQDACPRNQGLTPRESWPFELEDRTDRPELIPLLLGDEAYYRQALPEFPLQAGIDTLRRNVAIALGNSGDPAAVPPLVEALGLGPPKVRGAVAWALGRLGGPDARDALRRAAETEQDETVREEIREALRAMPIA